MRLTNWTDYTLRVLMYCAACEGRDRPVTISEIAAAHGISRSHLTKIVMDLSTRGWLETTRGRGGGLRLLKPASDINLGEVVRATETDFKLVECFDSSVDECRLSGHCALQGVLGRALQAFLVVLDGATLADLMVPGGRQGGAGPLVQAVVTHFKPGLPPAPGAGRQIQTLFDR